MKTVANRIIEFVDGRAIDRRITFDEYVEMKKAEDAE